MVQRNDALKVEQGRGPKALWAASALALGLLAAVAARAEAPAPATANFTRLWHQGRVTGDLNRIVDFYHGALGLGLRGDLSKALVFYANAPVNTFVGSPEQAAFRVLHMPIPGAGRESDGAEAITLEAFEYRDIGRRQAAPGMSDSGMSNLVFTVRDLEGALAAVKRAGAAVITPGGLPVAVALPDGASGRGRAVMVRDPDGYPVELLEVAPAAPSLAPAGSNVLGSATALVVGDLDASLAFYRGFLGQGARITAASSWRDAGDLAALRGTGKAAYRTASIALPGSAVTLQLIQFRGAPGKAYRPDYRDIGHAHLALYTADIRQAFDLTRRLGAAPLSPTGSWTTFSPTLKGFYTRDPDGFFLEVIEKD